MPKTANDYYQDLLKMKTRSKDLQTLLEAIQRVNEAGAKLRKPDQFKRIPYLHGDDRDKLMDLHKEVGIAAEAVVNSLGESKHVKKLVKSFAGLASANYTRLGAYDPIQNPKTLDAIEEETRTLYIDHSRDELAEKQGGALSSRIPVALADNKGLPIRGFFTPMKKVNVYETLTEAMKNCADRCVDQEKGKPMIMRLMENTKVKAIEMIKDKRFNPDQYPDPECQTLGLLTSYVMDENNYKEVDARRLAKLIQAVTPEAKKMSVEQVINLIGADALTQMAQAIEPHLVSVQVNMGEAGIEDNSRIDTRNAAMSAVADLLHMPNVIARSRPMVLTDKNGKQIQGTFIEEARGEDVRNLSSKAASITTEAFNNTDGRGFKSIADLQVLDYICGNMDRHGGNFLCQFDMNNKLVGVQGIDNDCSFGLYVPKEGEGKKRLPGLENLRVVSESTYERVMALNGDALKYALRGYGLSEAELDAASRRLNKLQKALSKDVEYFREQDEKSAEYDNANKNLAKDQDDDFVIEGELNDPEEFEFSMDDIEIEGENKGPEKSKVSVEGDKGKKQPEPVAPQAKRRLDKDGNPLPEITVPEKSLPLVKGHIRVLPDNQFRRLRIEDLRVMQDTRTGKEAMPGADKNYIESGNAFHEAYVDVYYMKGDYMKQTHDKQEYNAVLQGMDQRDRWQNLKVFRTDADNFCAKLKANTRFFHSNGKYRDMESAAKDYAKVMRRISERTQIANDPKLKRDPNYKMDVQAVVTPKDLQDMQKAAEKLNRAATAYLRYKLGPNMDRTTEGLTNYSKGRVQVAQELLQATKSLKVIKGDEMNRAQTNEREARENMARRLGDKAEAKVYQNRPKPQAQPILQ